MYGGRIGPGAKKFLVRKNIFGEKKMFSPKNCSEKKNFVSNNFNNIFINNLIKNFIFILQNSFCGKNFFLAKILSARNFFSGLNKYFSFY